MVAQVHCPQADTAVSAAVAQVEQAQQLAMVLAAVVAQQVEQVQQRSMTTSEVQQALLVPLQMHLPTSIGAAATSCASSVVHVTSTASASSASCQWGTPAVGVARVAQVQRLSMTTSEVQQALLVPTHEMHPPIDHHLLWSLRCHWSACSQGAPSAAWPQH